MISIKKIEENFETTLTYKNISDNPKVLELAFSTLSLVRDMTTQINTAISNFTFVRKSNLSENNSISKILKDRLSHGFGENSTTIKDGDIDDPERIVKINNYIMIPLSDSLAGRQNWIQTLCILKSKISNHIDLSNRVYQRAKSCSGEFLETIYWIIKEEIEALFDAIKGTCSMNEFLSKYFCSKHKHNINTIGSLTTEISRGETNA